MTTSRPQPGQPIPASAADDNICNRCGTQLQQDRCPNCYETERKSKMRLMFAIFAIPLWILISPFLFAFAPLMIAVWIDKTTSAFKNSGTRMVLAIVTLQVLWWVVLYLIYTAI